MITVISITHTIWFPLHPWMSPCHMNLSLIRYRFFWFPCDQTVGSICDARRILSCSLRSLIYLTSTVLLYISPQLYSVHKVDTRALKHSNLLSSIRIAFHSLQQISWPFWSLLVCTCLHWIPDFIYVIIYCIKQVVFSTHAYSVLLHDSEHSAAAISSILVQWASAILLCQSVLLIFWLYIASTLQLHYLHLFGYTNQAWRPDHFWCMWTKFGSGPILSWQSNSAWLPHWKTRIYRKLCE